jgi:hypothetical protein
MCTHDPACPPPDAIDWWAARNIKEHPGQGWTLLCNGALVFDDHCALLPDGHVAAISDVPRARLYTVACTGEGSSARRPPLAATFHSAANARGEPGRTIMQDCTRLRRHSSELKRRA